MLRAKSRISCNNVERHKVINSRISEVISANRKNPRLVIGSREWWRNVDFVSQRRNSTFVNLDSDSLNDLNDFLLCWALMIVTCRLQMSSSHLMWRFPRYLRGKFGTFSQNWREPPLDRMIFPIGFGRITPSFWHRSLRTFGICPWLPTPGRHPGRGLISTPYLRLRSLRRIHTVYRGINITPVIARAFEKVVYHTHGKHAVEGNLSRQTQFAYIDKGVIVQTPCYLFNIIFANF